MRTATPQKSPAPRLHVSFAAPFPATEHPSLFSDGAVEFLAGLVSRFRERLGALLERRLARQASFDRGLLPDFLPETAELRAARWTVASLPRDLLERKVEITGPVDRKMIINALNSGADVFMADFEDSNAPTWANVLDGQVNLYDAVRKKIRYVAPDTEKVYELAERTATLMVRPRGWHLLEKHVLLDGRPVPAALFDFALYFFHNARALIERGTGPYFYLPKLESHLEARLWNDVFNHAEAHLGLPRGTIKATVLIETLPAAFEMDEILHELREHSAGLNCGRWDYIFSTIKTLKAHASWVLPDRGQVTMAQPFLRAYRELLIQTCHRRGVHAIGGMAAQIPIKNDPGANAAALEKVRADKLREAEDGHDGTWVAHPGLVPVARDAFDSQVKGPHQIDRKREDVRVHRDDLLRVPEGTRTEAGLRQNVSVGVQYLEAYLRGVGCVPLYNLMEDAATAEISRAQVWQWIRRGAYLEDGRRMTAELVRATLDEEMHVLRREIGDVRFQSGRFGDARALFERIATQERYEEFLTLPAYDALLEGEKF